MTLKPKLVFDINDFSDELYNKLIVEAGMLYIGHHSIMTISAVDYWDYNNISNTKHPLFDEVRQAILNDWLEDQTVTNAELGDVWAWDNIYIEIW